VEGIRQVKLGFDTRFHFGKFCFHLEVLRSLSDLQWHITPPFCSVTNPLYNSVQLLSFITLFSNVTFKSGFDKELITVTLLQFGSYHLCPQNCPTPTTTKLYATLFNSLHNNHAPVVVHLPCLTQCKANFNGCESKEHVKFVWVIFLRD
jgi:hypothetical protein